MRTLLARLAPAASVLFVITIGCGTKADAPAPNDGVIEPGVATQPPPDVGPPPVGCDATDPQNPPIACGPKELGAEQCSSTSRVATCPTDNACMAPIKQIGANVAQRIGRLHMRAPDSLVSLTAIAFDPNISSRCAGGTEGMNWLLSWNRDTGVLVTGAARPSTDGRTFSFMNETFDGAAVSSICPGFVGASTPLSISPAKAKMFPWGTGFATAVIPQLNLTALDSVLPLRDVVIRVASVSDPTCIGSWNRPYWCDGSTLGWTPGGSIVGMITAEDADRVPVRAAGCQSLCAILVNDMSKTDGKVCRRQPDGTLPEIGTHCVGGTGCKNAFLFSASFASYGVTLTP